MVVDMREVEEVLILRQVVVEVPILIRHPPRYCLPFLEPMFQQVCCQGMVEAVSQVM